jgi:hypothetical protein
MLAQVSTPGIPWDPKGILRNMFWLSGALGPTWSSAPRCGHALGLSWSSRPPIVGLFCRSVNILFLLSLIPNLFVLLIIYSIVLVAHHQETTQRVNARGPPSLRDT